MNKCMRLTMATVPFLKLTSMQKYYVSLLKDPMKSLVVCTGPAGTGKTLFACKTALEQLQEKKIQQIVITKPLVSVEGEELGFLPGNMRSKMSPWIESYLDIFKEYYSKNQLEDMMKKEIIKLAPLAYCRGNTYSDSFVICDETQNTTPRQLKMLLTRLGENSKMVLIGDHEQQDNHGVSGLLDFTERLEGKTHEEIASVQLSEKDVCRSSLVKYILTLY
jgi:phosphate starvation-inducible PhoH-like protein